MILLPFKYTRAVFSGSHVNSLPDMSASLAVSLNSLPDMSASLEVSLQSFYKKLVTYLSSLQSISYRYYFTFITHPA
jgi:hypothetical protein